MDSTVKRNRQTRKKMRAHRARLRAQGLRPVKIWLPDTRAPKFGTQAHRQSRAVAVSAFADEDQAFIDVISG